MSYCTPSLIVGPAGDAMDWHWQTQDLLSVTFVDRQRPHTWSGVERSRWRSIRWTPAAACRDHVTRWRWCPLSPRWRHRWSLHLACRSPSVSYLATTPTVESGDDRLMLLNTLFALFSALNNCQVNEYETAKPALIRDIVIFEAIAKGVQHRPKWWWL